MSKILLVEDDSDMSEVLYEFLKIHHHEVHLAFNGIEGLELFKKISFDVVITDIIMPQLDGLEMLKAMLEIKPNSSIITLSGGHRLVPGVAIQYLDASIKLGAARSFCKPFKMAQLLTAIDELTS